MIDEKIRQERDIFRLEYELRLDKIIEKFRKEKIRAFRRDIRECVTELRPGMSDSEIGDMYYARDYNLNEQDYLDVWEFYRELHNLEGYGGRARKDKITFEPSNWLELAKVLIDAAKETQNLSENFFAKNKVVAD